MNLDKIHHRNHPDLDLIAADFDQSFIVRKFCGSAAIALYATLRVTGHDAQSSFLAAYGPAFFAHPDAIAAAAERFETTPTFRNAVDKAVETLGAERIAKELSARCDEASHFTQSHAMKWRVAASKSASNPTHIEDESFALKRDEASFADFAEQRRSEREQAAERDRIGNGIGGE